MSWTSAISENGGSRAEKIVDDYGFHPARENIRTPNSSQAQSRVRSRKESALLKKSLSNLRFHVPHSIILQCLSQRSVFFSGLPNADSFTSSEGLSALPLTALAPSKMSRRFQSRLRVKCFGSGKKTFEWLKGPERSTELVLS